MKKRSQLLHLSPGTTVVPKKPLNAFIAKFKGVVFKNFLGIPSPNTPLSFPSNYVYSLQLQYPPKETSHVTFSCSIEFKVLFLVVCTVFICGELNLTLVDSFLWKFDLPLLYIIVFNEVLCYKSPMGCFFWWVLYMWYQVYLVQTRRHWGQGALFPNNSPVLRTVLYNHFSIDFTQSRA